MTREKERRLKRLWRLHEARGKLIDELDGLAVDERALVSDLAVFGDNLVSAVNAAIRA